MKDAGSVYNKEVGPAQTPVWSTRGPVRQGEIASAA